MCVSARALPPTHNLFSLFPLVVLVVINKLSRFVCLFVCLPVLSGEREGREEEGRGCGNRVKMSKKRQRR